jgi:hypothetical protein
VRRAVPIVAVALASCLIAPAAPDYDPLAWLSWGRELWGLDLSTVEGPAFKPLPVAVTFVLAPLGDLAAPAWVVLARAAALMALAFAAVAGRRVSGTWLGGAGAAVGVLATGGFVAKAAAGNTEPLLVALALGAWLCAREGRPRAAVVLVAACALLRVEVWPFAAVAAVVAWRTRPALRPLLGAAALAVPLLWLVPELLGSGELFRSAARARDLEPGQPALAARPALASLRSALELTPLVLVPGLLALVVWRGARGCREGLVLATAGAAWVVEVALMAELGFSGERRYALPGAALIALAGGSGLAVAVARLRTPAAWRRAAAVAAGALLALALVTSMQSPRATRDSQRWRAGLDRDLRAAIDRAGGRERLLRCGRPYVGRFRGTLLAYRLDVAKETVDFAPRAPGVVFASRLSPAAAEQPAAPMGFGPLAQAGRWRLAAACRSLVRQP